MNPQTVLPNVDALRLMMIVNPVSTLSSLLPRHGEDGKPSAEVLDLFQEVGVPEWVIQAWKNKQAEPFTSLTCSRGYYLGALNILEGRISGGACPLPCPGGWRIPGSLEIKATHRMTLQGLVEIQDLFWMKDSGPVALPDLAKASSCDFSNCRSIRLPKLLPPIKVDWHHSQRILLPPATLEYRLRDREKDRKGPPSKRWYE